MRGAETDSPASVVVLDSGWCGTHNMSGKLLPSLRVSMNATLKPYFVLDMETDAHEHGSRCLEIVHALAPQATLRSVRIFEESLACTPRQLIDALNLLPSLAPTVVNLSLSLHVPAARDPLYAACAALSDVGASIVAAEYANRRGGLPALFDNVIGVRVDSAMASAVSFCDERTVECRVRLGLPITLADGRVVSVRSNSDAAAVISGVVSMIQVKYGTLFPKEVRDALRNVDALVDPWIRRTH